MVNQSFGSSSDSYEAVEVYDTLEGGKIFWAGC